ncbi:MAG: hypothetical protein KAQ65_03345 [Candidatus Thorarchaeota archaeon]|nr:hypothetical protein [Candidatus Thorarchaeota archaeon]
MGAEHSVINEKDRGQTVGASLSRVVFPEINPGWMLFLEQNAHYTELYENMITVKNLDDSIGGKRDSQGS